VERGYFYDKLLFYSVISNYRASWLLGKIKKTRTVSDRGNLSRLELPDIWGVGSLKDPY